MMQDSQLTRFGQKPLKSCFWKKTERFEESKQPTKNRWKKISLTLAQFDHHFSAEQCRLKYRAIKDKYQMNKKKSNTSGEAGSSNDQTALLDDVFEPCLDVTPTATIDSDSLPASTSSASASNSSVSASTSSASASNSSVSASTSSASASNSSASASASASATDAATDNDESDTLPKTKSAKRRRSGADEIKEFLKEREEDQERRHQERMSTAKELINLLAKLVDKS